ncbi:DUF6420 family protein [Streptomyces physcomitrii]|uniref:DUF6420 family protein n=1 Tax=Streptomyces physcomitrii TaxID=2724184 RepID=UPI00214FFBA1
MRLLDEESEKDEHRQRSAWPVRQLRRPPALHLRELDLPRIHPYGDMATGHYLTLGGGRLTVETGTAHHQITLDHLGCDAQTTAPKEKAFKQLALAAEGQCALAGSTHVARFHMGDVRRCFQVRTDWITPSPDQAEQGDVFRPDPHCAAEVGCPDQHFGRTGGRKE